MKNMILLAAVLSTLSGAARADGICSKAIDKLVNASRKVGESNAMLMTASSEEQSFFEAHQKEVLKIEKNVRDQVKKVCRD